MSKTNVGKVYRGRTKYIDPENKLERNYVVVRDNGKHVSVAKLKSVKKENDPALYELDMKKYPLSKRTGVDFQRFSKNRFSGRNLTLLDKDVFPEGSARFKLTSHDTYRVVNHTTPKKKKKPRH